MEYTLTYIGVGISPYACSVVTAIASQENPGTYGVVRVWNKNFMTHNGIIAEITEALKFKETSPEEVKKIRDLAMKQYNWSEAELDYRIRKENAILTHYYNILATNNDKVIENTIAGIRLAYKSSMEYLSFDFSESVTNIQTAISMLSGLINDGMVNVGEDLDISEIRDEIASLIRPENFNHLSPQLSALALCVGEAEFRRVNNREYMPLTVQSLKARNQGIMSMCIGI